MIEVTTTITEMLKQMIDSGVTVETYIKMCKDYEERTGSNLKGIPLDYCPVNLFASLSRKSSCKDTVAGLSECPICGHAMCPSCYNHNVEQLSRVTGYIQAVSGWNEAKKQELQDRKRYAINNGGML